MIEKDNKQYGTYGRALEEAIKLAVDDNGFLLASSEYLYQDVAEHLIIIGDGKFHEHNLRFYYTDQPMQNFLGDGHSNQNLIVLGNPTSKVKNEIIKQFVRCSAQFSDSKITFIGNIEDVSNIDKLSGMGLHLDGKKVAETMYKYIDERVVDTCKQLPKPRITDGHGEPLTKLGVIGLGDTNEEVVVHKRPERGITPRFILRERRMDEIDDAVDRFLKAGQPIPAEWSEEYSQLLKDHEEYESKKKGKMKVGMVGFEL